MANFSFTRVTKFDQHTDLKTITHIYINFQKYSFFVVLVQNIEKYSEMQVLLIARYVLRVIVVIRVQTGKKKNQTRSFKRLFVNFLSFKFLLILLISLLHEVIDYIRAVRTLINLVELCQLRNKLVYLAIQVLQVLLIVVKFG